MTSEPGRTTRLLNEVFGKNWNDPVGQMMRSSGDVLNPNIEIKRTPLKEDAPNLSRSVSSSSSSSSSSLSSNTSESVSPETVPTVFDPAHLPTGHENKAYNHEDEVPLPDSHPSDCSSPSSEFVNALRTNDGAYDNPAAEVEMTQIPETSQQAEDEDKDEAERLPARYERRGDQPGPRFGRHAKRRGTEGLIQSGIIPEPDPELDENETETMQNAEQGDKDERLPARFERRGDQPDPKYVGRHAKRRGTEGIIQSGIIAEPDPELDESDDDFTVVDIPLETSAEPLVKTNKSLEDKDGNEKISGRFERRDPLAPKPFGRLTKRRGTEGPVQSSIMAQPDPELDKDSFTAVDIPPENPPVVAEPLVETDQNVEDDGEVPGRFERRDPLAPKPFGRHTKRRATEGLVQSGVMPESDPELEEDEEKDSDFTAVEIPPVVTEPVKQSDSKPVLIKPVTWRGMFRYAERTDRILMFIGFVFAIIHGIALPCCFLLYRAILNILIHTDVLVLENATRQVYCSYICGNATEKVNSSSCSPALFTTVGASDVTTASTFNFEPFETRALTKNISHLTELVKYNCSVAMSAVNACKGRPETGADQVYEMYNKMCTYHILKTWGDVWPYALGIIGIGILTVIAAFVHILFWNLAAERQVCRIRSALFKSILSKHIGWFDIIDGRALNSQLFDETSKLLDGLGDKISVTIQMFTTFLTGFIISFAVNAELAGVVITLVPVLLIVAAVLTRTLRMFNTKQAIAYAKASSLSVQTLGNIRTVTAFGRQNFEVDRYASNLQNAKRTGIRKSVFTGLGQGTIWFVLTCTQALALWYGLNKARGLNEGGDVSLVLLGIMVGAMQFGQAAPNLEILATARAAASQIFTIIDEPTKLDNFSEEGKRPQLVKGAIEVENVNFAYPKNPNSMILKGLSFSVQPGQTVALVGASGSGKSTIIQILLRFYDAAAGRITLDGEDITGLNVGWLREQIGFVGQEPVLFSRSIADNIRMGKPDATMDEIVQACKLSNAHNFISLLPNKYDTFVGDRGAQLSGGQKQRIAIARGIINNPKILLLDEATSALDTHSERAVQEALDRASAGRTTIVIAHRLSTIKNADLILVLHEGEIVEVGKHDELLAKGEGGAYYALAQRQQLDEAVPTQEDEEEVDEDSPEAVFKCVMAEGVRRRTSTVTSRKDSRAADFFKRMSSVVSADESMNDAENEEEADVAKRAPFGIVLWWNAKEWYFIVLGCIAACIAGLVYPLQSTIISNQLGNFAETDPDVKAKNSQYNAVAQIIFGIVLMVSFTLQYTFFGISGEILTARLRRKSFASMLRQDISWFDQPENQPGTLAASLATDTTSIQGASGSRLGVILNLLANIGTAFIYGLVVCWEVTLAAFAVIPIFIAANVFNVRMSIGAAKKDSSVLRGVAQMSTEAICNMRTVVALGQHPYFLKEFTTKFEEIVAKIKRKASIQAAALGVAHGTIFFSWALVFGVGSALIDRGKLNFVILFRIYNMATVGSMAASRMAAFIPDMGKARVAAGKIYQLLRMEPVVDWTSTEGVKLVEFFGKVEFRNVKFHYPNRPDVRILRGLSFKVETGQTVALVGPSGCGKSTCLQLLERFYEPVSGEILIDDRPIKTINIATLRSKIGMIPQEPALFDATIWENIIYGTIDDEKIGGEVLAGVIRRRTQRSTAFVENLREGFETTVGDRGGQLSGGQKQRVAIARALARNPRLLLCDEATSALDSTNEKLVQADIDAAREGRTCLIVAHRLATIKHADKILVFHKGRIAEEGKHEELLEKRGHYYALHMAQNIGGGHR